MLTAESYPLIADVLQLELPSSGAAQALPGRASTLVIGPENELLAPPIQRLLAGGDPAELAIQFNPLMLVGPSGSGKSLIAQAVCRRYRSLLPENRIGYFPSADFGREVQAAYDEARLPEWRATLHAMRLLVLEDLQNLRPRATIQQEFRVAVDAIVGAGGLVMVTANREPIGLGDLDRGIADRLAAGLIVRVQNPGPAARRALIAQAAAASGVTLSHEQTADLAERDLGAPAHVFGAVAALRVPDRPADTRSLTDVARQHARIKQILAVAARYFGLTQAALVGPSRRSSLVACRNTIVYLARRLTTLSYADIGRVLGNRDHTTIMHAERRLAAQLAHDPVAQQNVDELTRLLS